MILETNPTFISTVVFDLGRVLVNIDFDAFPRSLGIEADHVPGAHKQNVERLVVEYETGRIGTNRFVDGLESALEHRFSRSDLLNAWNAIIGEENVEMTPLVKAIQERYVTAILSNTSPSHFAKALRTAPIIGRISRRYLSYEIGAMKPSPAVFEHMVRDLGCAPSSILFIDDIAENVSTAARFGIVSILFDGVGNLSEHLTQIGIFEQNRKK